ncbi:MAG: hypothetical protein K6F45_09140 [Saccharofermentans sp.]|nr:hypothetical protein [Saccharofermentans sp.]
MRRNLRKKTHLKLGSEGSSLAIALFFFMLCSLICAGILTVANSSIVSVSKNFDPDDVQEFTPESSASHQDIDPTFQNEVDAIDYVCDFLEYDFSNAFYTVENGGEYSFLQTQKPRNLTYEILSYIHAYYNNKVVKNGNTYFVGVDENYNVSETFIVTISGTPVKLVVCFEGTQGSKANGELGKKNKDYGLDFKKFTITVSAVDGSQCTYVRTYSYTVPDNQQFYIRWANKKNGIPMRFVVKGTK